MLFLIASLNIFGQTLQPSNTKKIDGFIVPVDLLDPAYPIIKCTGDAARDSKVFDDELRNYTKKLGILPQYKYTSDVIKDQETYEKSILVFLTEHPYFPQPLLSYDPQRDKDVFEALWKGYFKFFPDNAKRIITKEEGGVK